MKDITKDITKDKLLLLGFKEEFSSPEESGTEHGYYYYTHTINDECLLISDANDENDGYFTIMIFEFDSVKIITYIDLVDLIRVIKKNTIKL